MEFKDILKKIMQERELNQQQLAQIVGIAQSQVSCLLNGKSHPNYTTLRLFVDRLGVCPRVLFG